MIVLPFLVFGLAQWRLGVKLLDTKNAAIRVISNVGIARALS